MPPPQMHTAAQSLLSQTERSWGRILCTGISCLNAQTSSDLSSVQATCSEFCWSRLKSLGTQVGRRSQPEQQPPAIAATFAFQPPSQQQLCSALPASRTPLSSSCWRSPPQVASANTPGRSKRSGRTGSKALPWPGGELAGRGAGAECAARAGCRWHCGHGQGCPRLRHPLPGPAAAAVCSASARESAPAAAAPARTAARGSARTHHRFRSTVPSLSPHIEHSCSCPPVQTLAVCREATE